MFGKPWVLILPCLVLSPLKKERERILLMDVEGEELLGDQEHRTKEGERWRGRETEERTEEPSV